MMLDVQEQLWHMFDPTLTRDERDELGRSLLPPDKTWRDFEGEIIHAAHWALKSRLADIEDIQRENMLTWAADVLRQSKSNEAIGLLGRLLLDGMRTVRATAALSLQAVISPEALSTLRNARDQWDNTKLYQAILDEKTLALLNDDSKEGETKY